MALQTLAAFKHTYYTDTYRHTLTTHKHISHTDTYTHAHTHMHYKCCHSHITQHIHTRTLSQHTHTRTHTHTHTHGHMNMSTHTTCLTPTDSTWEIMVFMRCFWWCLSNTKPATMSDGTTSRSRKNSVNSWAISDMEFWKEKEDLYNRCSWVSHQWWILVCIQILSPRQASTHNSTAYTYATWYDLLGNNNQQSTGHNSYHHQHPNAVMGLYFPDMLTAAEGELLEITDL